MFILAGDLLDTMVLKSFNLLANSGAKTIYKKVRIKEVVKVDYFLLLLYLNLLPLYLFKDF